jgi:class 3 adenylate cyclase
VLNLCCSFVFFSNNSSHFHDAQVETVGDCYVAVTGLPDPRKDHAVAMAKFACNCLKQTYLLARNLEVSLGPDTADLTLRVGLHSGPVTAGVLRGERSRFQASHTSMALHGLWLASFL